MTTTLNAEAAKVEALPEGSHVLAILDASGDTRIIWDSDNEVEVANAKRTFDDFLKKGFRAFSVNRKGEKDKQIREFDESAEKMILAPALAGG
jgi:hypothetical protein